MHLLFKTIELLSNNSSFKIGTETNRNLWLFLHFKHLKIKRKEIYYQINNGIRQRQTTIHPIRRMTKKFRSTIELISYLQNKSYDLVKIEIEFTNGWLIKQIPYTEFKFYTNTTKERDQLIQKLLTISGQWPINISSLRNNYTYFFESPIKLIELDHIQNIDEFWCEEDIKAWKKSIKF